MKRRWRVFGRKCGGEFLLPVINKVIYSGECYTGGGVCGILAGEEGGEAIGGFSMRESEESWEDAEIGIGEVLLGENKVDEGKAFYSGEGGLLWGFHNYGYVGGA
jgi:hypothetical protein